MTAEIRTGRWQDVLADVKTCNALIFDPPYGGRIHDSEPTRRAERETNSRGPVGEIKPEGYSVAGLTPDYDSWSTADIHEVVASWSPRVTGWIAAMTSHDLIPAWETAFASVGRYCFHPVPCVINGMSVRLCGDGPSSWAIYLMVARPRTKEMAAWGTLPGAYVVNASRDSSGGRGKPRKLMDAIVSDYSREGDLVVDPTAGWGVTLTACEGLKRNSIGAEIVPHVADEARRRIVGGSRPGQTDLFG